MPSTGAGDHWARLGQAVRDRRDELGMTQAEVHAAGGPSPATLYLIETGQRAAYRPRLLRGLERSLGWQSGSVAAVLAGGQPLLDGDETAEPPTAEAPPAPRERIEREGIEREVIESWLAGFRALPLSPRERVTVLARLLEEAAAGLDTGAGTGAG